MPITKYASYEVSDIIDIKGTESKARTASLDKVSDFSDYRTGDGYLYARIRAISSRTNKNHDGWPSVELAGGEDNWQKHASQHKASSGFVVEANKEDEYGFSTFIGKPIFVDHNNSNPDRARGVIVDSKLYVQDKKTAGELDPYYASSDADPDHLPPTHVELLLEVDAKSFPRLAKAIVDGGKDGKKGIDGFSMGCDVDYSKCSHCGNKASSPQEYCNHIKAKGAEHNFTSSDGKRTSRKSYENCYGIKFFEISAVFDPADETALTKEIINEGDHKKSSYLAAKRANDEDVPQPITGEGMFQNGHPFETDATPQMFDKGQSIQIHDPQSEDHGKSGIYMGPDPAYPGAHFVNLEGSHSNWFNGNKVVPHGSIPVQERGRGGDGAYMLDQDHTRQGPSFREETGNGGWMNDELQYMNPAKVPNNLGPVRQGSTKVADNPVPQDELTKAPEDVDTLREEKVCGVCGSDMENGKCEVCGYEEPPEQMQNPDLSKAKEVDDQKRDTDQATIPADQNVPPAANGEGTSYLQARKPRPTANVKNDMRWTPTHVTAASGGGDEPNESVVKDQTAPVTSAFRTAQQLIDAAKNNQKVTMDNKVAAEPADASGKAQKRVNVDEIGGVDQASNENASKADAQVDVEGKGGVGVTDVSPDSTEKLDTAGRDSDDSGFNKDKTTDDSGPTKTFPNTKQQSPVTNKPFPSSDEGVKKSHDDSAFPKEDGGLSGGKANQGTQPADPVGKAQDRVNVLDHVTSPANNSGQTKTWSGTDGNGVTKQQDPVTRDLHEFNTEKASSAHIFAAFKQAETEVELGLTPKSDKYNRAQELTELSPAELQATASVTARVAKTASTRTATTKQATRVPSFKRIASDEATPTTNNDSDDSVFAAGLFGR